MNELKQWLDDANDADDFERSVLRSGLALDPPPGAEDAVWAGLLGTLALAPIPVAASVSATIAKTAVGGAGKATAVWLTVGKGFVVGLALYGAGLGASEVAARFGAPAPHANAAPKLTLPLLPPIPKPIAVDPESEHRLDAPAPMPATSSPNGARNATALPSALPTSTELPSVAAFPKPASGVRPSQLQAEAAALRSARAELRAGKLADAFATLEASRRQFSAPELYQEREALLIELLFRSGQRANARTRADAFMARFPESPHADAIRQFSVH
ncbi:MAG: hypothetical protein ABIQ16_23845 [Polyangiaceae bacterium]